ncbi:hypothetical protein [Streptomyces benahoarensis]|uniref:CurL C-terminal domain-containing protein n=1 Tax=Streptomyces benahoarensis TaxID=2595054 RepID=UPI003D806EDB
MADWLEGQGKGAGLGDVAYTLAVRRSHQPHRRAVMASSRAELPHCDPGRRREGDRLLRRGGQGRVRPPSVPLDSPGLGAWPAGQWSPCPTRLTKRTYACQQRRGTNPWREFCPEAPHLGDHQGSNRRQASAHTPWETRAARPIPRPDVRTCAHRMRTKNAP